jgi:hypothetical protein
MSSDEAPVSRVNLSRMAASLKAHKQALTALKLHVNEEPVVPERHSDLERGYGYMLGTTGLSSQLRARSGDLYVKICVETRHSPLSLPSLRLEMVQSTSRKIVLTKGS